MEQPLVSIIVPCYNQAEFLNDSLSSVLSQTFVNWECIIVNDGSSDNTELVANDWLKKDLRFKYYSKCNEGISATRNFGINKSSGTYILPLDADDKISDDYIKLVVKEFKDNESVKVAYSNAEKFGDESGIWDLASFSLKGLAFENLIFCSALYKKSDWERVGGYDVKMTYGFEDWEFWIAILKNGGEVRRIDTVGFYYRFKAVSRSKLLNDRQKKELYKYLNKKHLDFYLKQFGSFHSLLLNNEIQELNFNNKLKSKKFVVNLFCKTFLGFQIFKNHKL